MDSSHLKLQKFLNLNTQPHTDSTSSLANEENDEKNVSLHKINYNSEPLSYNDKIMNPKLKVEAIVSLNLGDLTEKITIYEGQNINDVVSFIIEKYNLKKKYIGFITEKILEQIKMHKDRKLKSAKLKDLPAGREKIISKQDVTPNSERQHSFTNLNTSKIYENKKKEGGLLTDRQRTFSPLRDSSTLCLRGKSNELNESKNKSFDTNHRGKHKNEKDGNNNLDNSFSKNFASITKIDCAWQNNIFEKRRSTSPLTKSFKSSNLDNSFSKNNNENKSMNVIHLPSSYLSKNSKLDITIIKENSKISMGHQKNKTPVKSKNLQLKTQMIKFLR